MYPASLRTNPLSRSFTRIALKDTSGQQASSGRLCHSATALKTASMIVEIRS